MSRTQDAMTIGELAERTGITVRNLREWRTLGLLPLAEMRGRVGYYPPEVLERVERIKKLRAEGFTLELIRRMLDVAGPAGDDAMHLAEILKGPFREGGVPPVDLEEWSLSDPAALQRALELGLVRERPNGGYEFTTQRIADVAAALRDLGLEIDEVLEVAGEVSTAMAQIAARFEGVWLEHVWAPMSTGEPSEDEVARISETAERMPSLALDTVVALFTVAMERQIEGGIARELDRQAERRSVDER
jgi:DNA-binding transcriptional MerR regulator